MPHASRITATAILATMAPGVSLADSSYWDSVLARGVIEERQPCAIARDDLALGRAPYFLGAAIDNPDPQARENARTAAQILCLRHLGAWGIDPIAAARDAAAAAGVAPDE